MDNRPVETTIYSLTDAPPRQPAPELERRDAERHLTLFRVGAMVVNGRRELCLIKNISAGGMMLRVYCALEPGVPVEVELKTGQPLTGRVTWVREHQVGIAFAVPVDVIAILASDEAGPRPRMPRIEVNTSAYVRDGAATLRLHCADISQGGIKVDTPTPLTPDAEVVVTLPGLAPQPAVVRWATQAAAGISFNTPLPLSELVDWLRTQRDAAKAA
ncbi:MULTISPECIES: PilZ domain-containing protein [Sphingomonas]|uniref:PilZ domain-containing protein n=1 Tax=Sphingomonas TaxID=13687 RepID=UPI00126A1F7D|nr:MULTISPECIES: PilZ domain-containing protein [Sphingomonas]